MAKKEFENYVQLLRELDLDVIEMEQEEELPESVFIDDAAVVCNNIALICKPGNPTRLKEVRRWGWVIKNYSEMLHAHKSDKPLSSSSSFVCDKKYFKLP